MHIWDFNLILTYCHNRIGYNKESALKYLFKKIVMLFMILGAWGKHALSTIYDDNIVFKDDDVILLPNKTLKHSMPLRPLQPLIYNAYKENIKLCSVNGLFSCLEWQKLPVNDDLKELVSSYGKLHWPVGSDTLSRWIKDELKLNNRILTYEWYFVFHRVANAEESRLTTHPVPIHLLLLNAFCSCEHVTL